MNIKVFIFLAVYLVSFRPCFSQAAELYALMDPGDRKATYSFYLSYKKVDGIAVRLSWADIEKKDNQYNWDDVDEAVKTAYTYRKGLTLHIMAADYTTLPEWLKPSGIKTYRATFPYKHNRLNPYEPIPWNDVYMNKWSEFLRALSDHLNQQQPKAIKSLRYISINVPVSEMDLIYCNDGKMSGFLNYSREWYLYSWQRNIESMAKAFPNVIKLLPVPLENICAPDYDGVAFFSELYKFAGPNFMPYARDLNGYGSERLGKMPLDVNTKTAMQFEWSYSVDPYYKFNGELANGVCKGMNDYQGDYFEVYKDDVKSDDLDVKRALSGIHSVSACK